MMVENQRYEFTPPDGASDTPIVIFGMQEYSPGQQQSCDVWRIEVPKQYRDWMPDESEYDNFGEVMQRLAAVFFDGDEAQTRDRLIQKNSG